MKVKPQWNDWRCYRCGRWQPAGTGQALTLNLPFGRARVLVCDECAKGDS